MYFFRGSPKKDLRAVSNCYHSLHTSIYYLKFRPYLLLYIVLNIDPSSHTCTCVYM